MDHTYRDIAIRPCNSAQRGPATGHAGRWILQSYHRPTGMPWADEFCQHAITLAEARARIDLALDWASS